MERTPLWFKTIIKLLWEGEEVIDTIEEELRSTVENQSNQDLKE